MDVIAELQSVFPQPLLGITQEYLGDKICMDELIYNEIVSILANDVYRLWQDQMYPERLINLLYYDGVYLVTNVLDYANIKDSRFWQFIYDNIPMKDVDIFLDKYGDLIAKSGYLNEEFDPELYDGDVEYFKELHQYKVDKLNEYMKLM